MGRVTSLLKVDVISPVHAPVRTSRLQIAGRDSVILTLQFGQEIYQGEASPLAGYGQDSFDNAHSELQSLVAGEFIETIAEVIEQLRSQGLEFQHPNFQAGQPNSLRPFNDPLLAKIATFSSRLTSPSARFCVEMLMLEAIAREANIPEHALFCDRPVSDRLATSAVIDPLSRDWRAKVAVLRQRGVHTFKLKCGRDLATEMAVCAELSAYDAVTLRLDPNAEWTKKEASQVLRQCNTERVEWVEDPTAEVSDWSELASRYPLVDMAVDESLVGREPDPNYLVHIGASVVVLKPMALGGFLVCLKWAELARGLGLKVCVSHLFDGPLALDAATQLAFALQSSGSAPGLGAHAGLAGYRQCSDSGVQRRREPLWLKKNEPICLELPTFEPQRSSLT